MRVSLYWLSELCPIDASEAAVAERLMHLGFEVEMVERLGQGIDDVVVAQVLGVQPHPRADRLRLVEVSDGRERHAVVCGAPNVPAPGGRVALARPGTRLPSGLEVTRRAIRGVESAGMLCSESELGIGDDADGILVLSESAVPGRRLVDELPIRDAVFEIAVTPNRPDALGMIGIARELSAAFEVPLKMPATGIDEFEVDPATSRRTSVEVNDPRCSRYVARVIDGITVAQSPFWLRRRLQACGMRPISNVVDVTNYVMLETGHPLHAFDLDRLAEGRIVVRSAHAGERMHTLDGAERALSTEDCLICDARAPVALGGVMGGAHSEVLPTTHRLLLEAAYFEPRAIRRTARRLGLTTESSTRFERGCDPNGADYASRRAARLLGELASGHIARGAVDVYPKPFSAVSVSLRPSRCRQLLGLNVSDEEMQSRLTRLGLSARPVPGALQVSVPTFRTDLTREVDLIEEIARLGGLQAIPEAVPPLLESPGASGNRLVEAVRDALVSQGYCEAISLAFTSLTELDRLDPPANDERRNAVALKNPLGEELALMRTTLLPGLLRGLSLNLQRGSQEVRLFEVGYVFTRAANEPPHEGLTVAGILRGHRGGWLKTGEPVDFFDASGATEWLARRLGVTMETRPAASTPFHPGQCAQALLAGRPAGFVGQIDPRVRARFGIETACFGFELGLEGLAAPNVVRMQPLPRFPAVARDLSVFLPERLTWAELAKDARAPLEHLESVDLLDEYRPPSGLRGLLIRFTYRSPERTLTDEEVNRVHETRVAELLQRFSLNRR